MSRRARLPVLALIAVTAAGGVLRFYRIDHNGLWLDEAFSVWMAQHPRPEMFGWLTRIDQHPPLYYTLLHFWLAAGDAEGYVRGLSALLSTLAIPVLYGIGRRIGGAPVGLVAAVILALSSFQVRYAQEARMYALLTLCVALAVLGLVEILTAGNRAARRPPVETGGYPTQNPPRWVAEDVRMQGSTGFNRFRIRLAADFNRWQGGRRRPWLLYIVFTAAAILTHSTALFFPVAANLFVIGFILHRRRRPATAATEPSVCTFTPPLLRTWLLAQGAVLLLWLPWSYSFVIQSIGVYRQFWIQPPTPETAAGAGRALLNDFLPPYLPGALVWLGYALLIALGAAALRKRLPVLMLLLALLLTPVLGELLVSLRRPIFSDRTLIWLAIPLCLLLAFGILHLRPRPLAGLGLALLCAINLLSLHNFYTTFQKEEWREAAADLAQQVRADDLILFNATWVQLPFDYYFGRYDLPVTEHGAPVDLFDSGVLEPIMTAADLPRLRSLIEGHDRVWLVYSHDWYTDPDKLIPAALDAELEYAGAQQYYGLQVLSYER